METIILPGYSEHNKEWAEEIAKDLSSKSKDRILVHNWLHWENPSISLSLSKEIEKILHEVGGEKVNLITKSVGVMVALKLIPRISAQINKVILCGIASVSGEDRKDLLATVLTSIPTKNILCIQNEKDKYVTYAEAEKFYHSVEPGLKVISMPRSDHDYPYPEVFADFLIT